MAGGVILTATGAGAVAGVPLIIGGTAAVLKSGAGIEQKKKAFNSAVEFYSNPGNLKDLFDIAKANEKAKQQEKENNKYIKDKLDISDDSI